MSTDRKGSYPRSFPTWLIDAEVSAEAIILWSQIHSLSRHGSRGICDASVEFLAEQLPKRRGKVVSARTVKGLLLELVAAGALDIVPIPGQRNQYVPHRTPVARNLDMFAAAAPGARRASDPRPTSSPAAVVAPVEALADRAPASESEGLDTTGAHPCPAPTPAVFGGDPCSFQGVPLQFSAGTPAVSCKGPSVEEVDRQEDPEFSTAPSIVLSIEGSMEEKAPPPPAAPPAPVATVEIEVQRIFVAYRHAIRELGPRIEELRKASGDRRPPPGILRPIDRAAAAQAASLGTCHPFSNEQLQEEFSRTALGLLRAGYDASLRAVLNHVGEAWAEAHGQSYPGGDDAQARLAELAEIAGVSVEELRARNGGDR